MDDLMNNLLDHNIEIDSTIIPSIDKLNKIINFEDKN